MEYQLVDNKEKKRFEYQLEKGNALVEYIKTENKIYLTHTEVPPRYEGQGIASALVKDVLGEVEKSGLKLVPLCPYVAAYIKRNPDWKKVLDSRVNIG
jgi:predicted GNAT family acetyltransferase